MNRTYQGNYYENIFLEENGGEYSNRDYWYPFFEQIAKNIVMNYAPRTVLDAGCAFGYLVEALRAHGVEAYGLDISDYAIGHTAESIREYCAVGSVVDEEYPASFPERFDLIVCIEVLEHIQPEEGEKAIRNFCRRSDRVLFSSTDTDISDVTHVNVQRKEYWARLFAKEGFFRDVQQRPWYVSAQADVYQRRSDIENVVQEYEIVMRVEREKKKHIYHTSNMYYDMGTGFTEDQKIVLPEAVCEEEEKLECDLEIPKGVKTVRFDPIEGIYCMLSEVQIVLDDRMTEARPVNGVITSGIWLFTNRDPQILIETGEGRRLRIRGKIFLMKDMSIAAFLKAIADQKKTSREKVTEELAGLREAVERLGESRKVQMQGVWEEIGKVSENVEKSERQQMLQNQRVWKSIRKERWTK